MAAGGGGAWKVAYADFVTAMMAFFLVMWLVGQDQQTKQAITRYFNNPSGFKPMGESKFPDSRGSVFSSQAAGEVPESQEVKLGNGRNSYSGNNSHSPSTKMMGDHIFSEQEEVERWEERAQQELAAANREYPDDPQQAEKAAVAKVGKKMREDVIQKLPEGLPEVYKDLIYDALNDVNWRELAEDVLADGPHQKKKNVTP